MYEALQEAKLLEDLGLPENVEVAPEGLLINPQLCKVFNPKKNKIARPMWLEPKFDGLRGVNVVRNKIATVFSRNGKPFWNIDHILKEAANDRFNDYFLDGEFFSKDWNQSMSILKRQQIHPDASKINFYVWDMVPLVDGKLAGTTIPLRDRYALLESRLNLDEHKSIKLVKHKIVTTYDEIQQGYAEFLAEGYEGGILKDPDGPYELGRRSPYWLKLKPWNDADLVVTGAYEGNGKHVGRLGKVLLEGDVEWHGKTYHVITECGTGFSDSERTSYWTDRNEMIGQTFEVKYQEITEDNCMRFPVFSRWRQDK